MSDDADPYVTHFCETLEKLTISPNLDVRGIRVTTFCANCQFIDFHFKTNSTISWRVRYISNQYVMIL